MQSTFRPSGHWFLGRIRPYLLLAVVGVVPLAAGCSWLVPWIFIGEHVETVPAEYAKLAGHKTAIVVWAPTETLFDYPHVRMELGMHVADHIRANVSKTEIVDGRLVEDYIERSADSYVDPEQIGREFGADRVVYTELITFEMRDPQAPDYLRANIHATVTVFDLQASADEPQRYDLEDVTVVYPENGPVLLDMGNASRVRKEAYEMFGEYVGRKFYDYEREM